MLTHISWCVLLLHFEYCIAHYLETRHFSWDSAHILCSARTSLIVVVFSQSANRQNNNQNNVFQESLTAPIINMCSSPVQCNGHGHMFLKMGAVSDLQIKSTERNIKIMGCDCIVWQLSTDISGKHQYLCAASQKSHTTGSYLLQ